MGRSRPVLWHCYVLAVLFGFLSTLSHDQTLHIKLLDGRNGHPMANSYVNVWVGNTQKAAMPIPTDKDGIATVHLTENAAEIDVHKTRKASDDGVVVPVVKYSDSFRVNAGFVFCQSRKADCSWLAIQSFSTADVLRSGVATANVCGKAKASPEPGELVIFVMPLTFGEKIKE